MGLLLDSGTGSPDLDRRSAIHDLVVRFYREIVFDDLLEPVFGEVAEVDWSVHIPKLIDYWCRVLLGEPGYVGAIIAAHREVHDIEPFRLEHFDRWYSLWVSSVDANWLGPFAEHAKRHAARLATSLARQLLGSVWQPPQVTETPVATGASVAPPTAPRRSDTASGTADR